LKPVLFAAALLGGCSGLEKINPLNWWGDAPTGPKPTPLQEIKPTLTLIPLWRAAVGGAGEFLFTPAAAAGTVFAAAADGTVLALDAGTGAQKWRVTVSKAGLSAGVGSDGETVVVGTLKGEVIALDGTGKERWRTQASSEILASPVVAGGLALVRTSDNRVHAYDAADGRRRWVYQRTAPALILRNFSGLAVGGGSVFVGFPGGKLVALAVSNGSLRWEGTVALPKGATELERIADVIGVPVLRERMVCAVAFQGRAACFDIANGQALWTRDVSSQTGLAADARYAFVSEDRSAVIGLAAETGSSLWKQDRLAYRGISAPLSIGRAVIIGDREGIVHALAREDGTLIGRVATDGSWIAATPLRVQTNGEDIVLVQTRNGGLFAFGGL
jgi:outer membrane protein assembly factor BamB